MALTKKCEVINLKEKNTGMLFKAIKVFGDTLLFCFEDFQRLLPTQYFILNSTKSYIIRDSKLDKTICEIDKTDKNVQIILISENGELIVSKDIDFITENYGTADPFIELLSCNINDIPDSLIDMIDDYSHEEYWQEKYPQVTEVITSFDFAQAAIIFKKMGYEWGGISNGTSSVPTLMDIKKSEYRRLLEEFFEEKCYFEKCGTYKYSYTSCGRFTIDITPFDENGKPQFKMNLLFTPVQTII